MTIAANKITNKYNNCSIQYFAVILISVNFFNSYLILFSVTAFLLSVVTEELTVDDLRVLFVVIL